MCAIGGPKSIISWSGDGALFQLEIVISMTSQLLVCCMRCLCKSWCVSGDENVVEMGVLDTEEMTARLQLQYVGAIQRW